VLNDAYCVNGAGTTSTSSGTPTGTVTLTSTSATAVSAAAVSTVAAPGPTQTGIASNCDQYVLQSDGVYCYDMAQNADITLTELYEWNPALDGDCSGLWAGYAYCVGVVT